MVESMPESFPSAYLFPRLPLSHLIGDNGGGQDNQTKPLRDLVVEKQWMIVGGDCLGGNETLGVEEVRPSGPNPPPRSGLC